MSFTCKAQSLFITFIAMLMMASSAQAQWMPWDGWVPRGQPLPWDGWWYQQGQQPYYYVPPRNGQAPATAQCPSPEPVVCDDGKQSQQAGIEQLKAAHVANIAQLEARSQSRVDQLKAELATASAQISTLKAAADKHQQALKSALETLKTANREASRLKQALEAARARIADLEKLDKRTKGQLRAASSARRQCLQEAESEREQSAARLLKFQKQLQQCERLKVESAGLKRQLQDQLQDSDGDGVINAADRCPASAEGVAVDASGCEADDDADGVGNRLDLCADSKPAVRVAADGCEVGRAIALPDVQFVSGSAQLLPAAQAALDELARRLVALPGFYAEVAGHTDSVGDATLNLRLSRARAEAVRMHLISKGVAAERLTAKGYGETQAIADNKTRAGRAKNRRVELRRATISK